jgi:hypothetical protein
MVLTGWTYDELRSQPAPVVRALFWRIFASRFWDRRFAAAAREPLPEGAGFEARIAKADALEALRTLEEILWPEGD